MQPKKQKKTELSTYLRLRRSRSRSEPTNQSKMKGLQRPVATKRKTRKREESRGSKSVAVERVGSDSEVGANRTGKSTILQNVEIWQGPYMGYVGIKSTEFLHDYETRSDKKWGKIFQPPPKLVVHHDDSR